MNGYIKLSRKLLDWDWYKDVNTCKLFIHMLLIASYCNEDVRGVEVPRGSFVSSYQKLAAETGLSLQNVRTAVKHLKSTRDLTFNQHGKNSVFTVNSYDFYSLANTETNTQLTGKQHGGNTPIIKENKNKIIKERENKRARELEFANFVQRKYQFGDLEELLLCGQKAR